jgi:hypothetical protein
MEVRHVDLDAGVDAAAAAKDSRLEKLREDRVAKAAEPRPIVYGQLLTAEQHKTHITEHFERCKAKKLEVGARVGGARELEQALTAHGFKLSEVAATDVTGDGRVLKTTLHVDESSANEWERPWELARATIQCTLWLEPQGGGAPMQLLHTNGGTGGRAAAPIAIWIDEPPEPTDTQPQDQVGLPEGLESALKTMRRGETARVSIRPDATKLPTSRPCSGSSIVGFPEGHAHYGKALVAEVTLISFENPSSVMMMGADEELEKAAECKSLGNRRFKNGDYGRALRRYKRALELLEYDEKRNFAGWEEDQKVLQAKERVSVLNNMAMVHFKVGEYDVSRKICGRVLAAQPSNTKAKYRRGMAYLATGGEHIADGIDDLKAVLAQEPTNNQAKKELAKAKKALKAYKETPEAKEAQAKGLSSGLKNMFETKKKAQRQDSNDVFSSPSESSKLISATEKLAQLEAAEAAKKKKDSSSPQKNNKKTTLKHGQGHSNVAGAAVSASADLRKVHDQMPSDVNALLSKMADEAGIDINSLPDLMARYDKKHAGGLRAQADGGGLGKDIQGLDSLEAELDALEAQLDS